MESSNPDICRLVHYRTHGSADGTYTQECVPALVTQRARDDRPGTVGLTVFNPVGMHMHPIIGIRPPGHPPEDPPIIAGGIDHGTPHQGGTWHWPQDCPWTAKEAASAR